MKKLLLALSTVFTGMSLSAQPVPPEELRGSWLSSATNTLEYGLYEHFAIADGDFWDYSVIREQRNETVLLLQNGDKTMELLVTPAGDRGIAVESASGRVSTLTSDYNENPDFGLYEKEGFQEPIIRLENFHLKGFVRGYDREQDQFRYIRIIYNPLLEEQQRTHIAQLDSLGRFTLDFPLLNPQEIMIDVGKALLSFYAVPGSSLTICINKNERHERKQMLFSGQERLLNAELNNYKPIFWNSLPFQLNSQQTENLEQHDYKDFRLGKMEEQLQHLAGYARAHRSSRKFRQQMENRIRYSAANDLMRYAWLHDRDEKERLSEAYLTFIERTPLENKFGLITQEFNDFLDEYRNFLMDRTGLYGKFSLSMTELVRLAKANGTRFDPGDEEKLLYLASLQDSVAAQKYYEADSAGIQALGEKYQDEFIDITEKAYRRRTDSVSLAAVASLAPGIGRDILTARIAMITLEQDRQPLTEARLKLFENGIGNRGIYNFLERKNEEFLKSIAGDLPGNTTLVASLKAKQDKLFKSLVEKYRGQVVYVDFWAPWCGPCMAEMPNSKFLKKELAGKDVVFLYLGVNCSEESWQNTIKAEQIEGEHYLLSDDEYSLLSGRFQISGIPRYILVDREGNVSDPDAERPGSGTALMTDIRSLLE